MTNRSIKASRVKRARLVEKIAKFVTGACLLFAAGATVAIIGVIICRGAPSISWEFLTAMPKKQMTAGGIWPAIYGTIMLTVWTALFALPVGIGAGIYLAEYAKPGTGTRIVRLSIANMAGVPVDRLRPVRLRAVRRCDEVRHVADRRRADARVPDAAGHHRLHRGGAAAGAQGPAAGVAGARGDASCARRCASCCRPRLPAS